MSEASPMSGPRTCEAMDSAISSPGLEDGPTPCALPAGPMTDLFGQALVPASPSAPRGASVAERMSATYGLRGSGSSASAALQLSLASRFQERLDSLGSTMFALTWRTKVTPLGRRISQQRASARGTFELDCGGRLPIPTPTACDFKGSGRLRLERGTNNNLRDWFKINLNMLYPPAACTRYLMGYPIGWDDCAPTAMPSSRKSRPSS